MVVVVIPRSGARGLKKRRVSLGRKEQLKALKLDESRSSVNYKKTKKKKQNVRAFELEET